jgi:hypothetical protein
MALLSARLPVVVLLFAPCLAAFLRADTAVVGRSVQPRVQPVHLSLPRMRVVAPLRRTQRPRANLATDVTEWIDRPSCEWVEQSEDGEEPPLTQLWFPLRETGSALKVSRWRKRLLLAVQSPWVIVALTIFSWYFLPFVGNAEEMVVGRLLAGSVCGAPDVETFASLVDVVIGSLGIVLGILVGTVISSLRDRLQELRNELYDELAVVEVT